MITHYDLFAGIGGFSLALEEVFHDEKIKHIFCEWEAFPTAVLKKHWPDATYYGDIADLVADTAITRRSGWVRDTEGRDRLRGGAPKNEEHGLAIVTGGFPCQPFSAAGQRRGTADDRYQWPNMFAVIRNVKPDWIIAENVRGLATWNDGMVLETVCHDLENENYTVQPFIIPAVGVDAPHRRDRIWIVAHTNNTRTTGKPRNDARSQRSERLQTRDEIQEPSKSNGIRSIATDTKRERWRTGSSDRQQTRVRSRHERFDTSDWDRNWQEIAFATCYDGVDDGIPRWMDGTTISAARHRKERLKAMGNAIVPQVAVQLFSSMRTSMEATK